MILRQAKLLESGSSSDLDLGSDNVNARDLFCDSVLDLAADLLAPHII